MSNGDTINAARKFTDPGASMWRVIASGTLVCMCLPANFCAQKADRLATQPSITISHASTRTAPKGAANRFTGAATVEELFAAKAPSKVSGGAVTFAPGARSVWHSHPLGQILIVTAGTGVVQMEGGPVFTIRAGDVVRIPPNVKHWHGATPAISMTHIAIQESLDGSAVTWMEPVSEQQYRSKAQ